MMAFPDATSVADYARLAQACLSDDAWEYVQQAAGSGLTLANNRAALDALTLIPRPLQPMAGASTRLNLFGQSFAHPMLLAPIAYQRWFHEDGEMGSAAAASAQGGGMLVSSLASQPLEQIAGVSDVPLWFQLYWQGGREATLRLLRRAEAAGYAALVVTVDAPVKQAVCVLPSHISAVNVERSLHSMAVGAGQSQVFDGWMVQAPTWQDMCWLRDQTSLPLLIKGILHPADAQKAVEIGFDGVVVSNHGGRVLDSVVSSVDALRSVVAQVQGRVPVLFDSGVRSGLDVAKVLQLGASAVLVGRPFVYGLAVAGALGVAHVMRLLRDELEMTLALAPLSA